MPTDVIERTMIQLSPSQVERVLVTLSCIHTNQVMFRRVVNLLDDIESHPFATISGERGQHGESRLVLSVVHWVGSLRSYALPRNAALVPWTCQLLVPGWDPKTEPVHHQMDSTSFQHKDKLRLIGEMRVKSAQLGTCRE